MIEAGLHYHLGIRYEGKYKDGLENGTWTMTLNDVLCSTCEFKKGFMDGEMKLFNEDGDIIYLGVFDKGIGLETLANIVNVKEITRVLNDLSKNYDDIWKIEDNGNGGVFKGEG